MADIEDADAGFQAPFPVVPGVTYSQRALEQIAKRETKWVDVIPGIRAKVTFDTNTIEADDLAPTLRGQLFGESSNGKSDLFEAMSELFNVPKLNVDTSKIPAFDPPVKYDGDLKLFKFTDALPELTEEVRRSLKMHDAIAAAYATGSKK